MIKTAALHSLYSCCSLINLEIWRHRKFWVFLHIHVTKHEVDIVLSLFKSDLIINSNPIPI